MALPWTWIHRNAGFAVDVQIAYHGAYAFGKFYVPASNGAGVAVSSDLGVSWTVVDIGQGANSVWRVKLVNGALYALCAGGVAKRCADGTTWASCTTGTTNPLYDIIHDGTRYIYCGGVGTLRYSTSDTLTGSSAVAGTTVGDYLFSIEKAGSLYICGGYDGGFTPVTQLMYTSASGTGWSRSTTTSTGHLLVVRYLNGYWFRGGPQYNATTPRLQRSVDGSTWTNVTLPAGFTGTVRDIIYTNSMWIVVGTSNSAAYSYDAASFDTINAGFNASALIISVVEGGGTVVMSGGGAGAGNWDVRTAFISPQRFYGTTRDKTGALAARGAMAIRESTKTVVHSVTSDAVTGAYQLETPFYEPHTLVFSGESDRNAIVYSGVMPG